MTTRRSPASAAHPATPSQRVGVATATTQSQPQTAARPQDKVTVVTLFLALLAATSFIGSAYSAVYHTSAQTSFRSRLPASSLAANLAASGSSIFPHSLPYFADKRNFINQFFVKRGWFWTVVAYLGHSLVLYFSPPPGTPPGTVVITSNRTPLLLRRVRSLLLATTYWWYLTQGTWFLGAGPSLAQRVLLYTGAQCVPASLGSSPATPVTGTLEAPICTGTKGEYYRGGHDVSGHTFLLVLSSLLLVDLIAPVFTTARQTFTPQQVRWSAYAVGGLVVMWWWMLVMTSVYFHTPQEKVTGFLFAVGGWFFSKL